jgi:hypothetical protein
MWKIQVFCDVMQRRLVKCHTSIGDPKHRNDTFIDSYCLRMVLCFGDTP